MQFSKAYDPFFLVRGWKEERKKGASFRKPVSPAKWGKIGHFQTFKVWTFVPAIFWFLIVCMVKMWSDRLNSRLNLVFRKKKDFRIDSYPYRLWLKASGARRLRGPSACCTLKKSSRKDSWYQDYSVLLTAAPSTARRQPAAFVPKTARNIWTQADSILVERTNNQNIQVLLPW